MDEKGCRRAQESAAVWQIRCAAGVSTARRRPHCAVRSGVMQEGWGVANTVPTIVLHRSIVNTQPCRIRGIQAGKAGQDATNSTTAFPRTSWLTSTPRPRPQSWGKHTSPPTDQAMVGLDPNHHHIERRVDRLARHITGEFHADVDRHGKKRNSADAHGLSPFQRDAFAF